MCVGALVKAHVNNLFIGFSQVFEERNSSWRKCCRSSSKYPIAYSFSFFSFSYAIIAVCASRDRRARHCRSISSSSACALAASSMCARSFIARIRFRFESNLACLISMATNTDTPMASAKYFQFLAWCWGTSVGMFEVFQVLECQNAWYHHTH